jgi:hypothetical protein
LPWYSWGGLPGHFCMCLGSGQSGPLLYATPLTCQAGSFVSNVEHYSPEQVMPKSMPTMKSGCHVSVAIVQKVSRNALYWLIGVQMARCDTTTGSPLFQKEVELLGRARVPESTMFSLMLGFQLQPQSTRDMDELGLWSWRCKPQCAQVSIGRSDICHDKAADDGRYQHPDAIISLTGCGKKRRSDMHDSSSTSLSLACICNTCMPCAGATPTRLAYMFSPSGIEAQYFQALRVA